jgi:hypothetical protein
MRAASTSEITFEVHEDEVDGGYTAVPLGYGIHTQADSVEELRAKGEGSSELLLRRDDAGSEDYPAALRSG